MFIINNLKIQRDIIIMMILLILTIIEICLIIFIIQVSYALNDGLEQINDGEDELEEYTTGVKGLIAGIVAKDKISDGREQLEEGRYKLRNGYKIRSKARILLVAIPSLYIIYYIVF